MITRLDGNITIIGSKDFPDEIKTKVVKASEGKKKMLRLTFVDSQGNEVVLQGKIYESSAGSLTARLATRVEGCELIELDARF